MGHIGQKGNQSMEKMIDKSRAYETYRLAWDDIAKLLSDQIKAVLGRRFLLRVWPEDQGYWGARALHGLFSVADLNRLLDAVQADAETRMETLPEDSEDVHGFGMTLGSLLLKAALQADWKCEMVEDDALWMIGFVSSETRPYTVSGLLRSLNPAAAGKRGSGVPEGQWKHRLHTQRYPAALLCRVWERTVLALSHQRWDPCRCVYPGHKRRLSESTLQQYGRGRL